MNRFWKIGACVLAAALFAYLVFFDYARLKVELSPTQSEKTTATAQTGDASSGNAGTTTEEQIAQLESELNELYQQRQATQVALCFAQLSDFLYDDIYPELAERGYLPMAVFTEDWLPGDYWRISVNEFTELSTLGWTFAVGGSSALDDQDVETWQTRLEEYMERIRVRAAAVPSVYCFDQGEYNAACDSILEALGFTSICYYAEDAAADANENSLAKIVQVSVSADTDSESLIDTLKQYSGAVITVQLSQSDEAGEGQISVSQYFSLLDELETSSDIEIVSYDEASAAASNAEQQTLLEEISAMEAELEQLLAQSGG